MDRTGHPMIIQMSDLADDRFGRFGNQLFKFFFLKVIEHEIDCEIRFPSWLGNVAFNIPTSKKLATADDIVVIAPDSSYSLKEVLDLIRSRIIAGTKVLEIKGFFQFHTHSYAAYKNIFDETFMINSLLKERITRALHEKDINNKEMVSIHIRRGDYVNYADSKVFWMTPIESIFNSLQNLDATGLKEKVLYVCSDDMAFCKSEFDNKGIDYLCADDFFAFTDETTKLLVDFCMMTLASVNIISNSSLSFFASMQNSKSNIFLRPSPSESILLPYSPWNSEVLIERKQHAN
jgi:hypothetical protein